MPRRVAPLLVLALLAAGCLQAPAAEITPAALVPLDAEGYAPVLFGSFQFQEVDLGTVDGLRLHADVYLPDGASVPDAPTAFPTILMLSPYWGAGTGGTPEHGYMPYDFLAKRLLPRGYAVVYGDLAGNGGSGGCWDFMGPVERQNAFAMVEAIAEQEWSDGKVAMYGLSYDGMTQIMAASDAPPHLVTVVPAAPLTHAYAGLRQGGVHYAGGWHSTIAGYESSTLAPTTNAERVPGWSETVAASPTCVAGNHQGDATGEYNEYYQARDYRPLGANVNASVFYMQGFRDGAVKPDNFGDWFAGVPTTKKAWLGFWNHQYPVAQNSGREDMYLTVHRWFDHTLKGAANGIDAERPIDVQDSLGRWRKEDAWPPADATPRVLQLSSDGTLVESGATAGDVGFGGPAGVSDLVRGDGAGRATFGGFVAKDGLHIAGAPSLALTLESDRPVGVVIARLYDGERLVSQGAYDLRFAGGLERAELLTPGAPVTIDLAMYPTDWAVVPGHELRLELSTHDALSWYDSDVALSTLTLAAGETATLTLPTIERAGEAFFLTACGRALGAEVKGCYDEDREDAGTE